MMYGYEQERNKQHNTRHTINIYGRQLSSCYNLLRGAHAFHVCGPARGSHGEAVRQVCMLSV
eukprot:9490343-Pyramimonas_sp.AAC.2